MFWIGGFSLLQESNCYVWRKCGVGSVQCAPDAYTFACGITSTMHDLFIYPSDFNNSGQTASPDVWDKWNYGGTPFYVNGSWTDSVSGGGTLP
jgi:hypothetical protein